MKITKKQDHYLFQKDNQEYHLSIEDYNKLGEFLATEYVKIEMEEKTNAEFNEQTINFQKARNLGFCEFGIKDFCTKLDLDVNKTYKISYLRNLLTENKLDLMFNYSDELIKLFGKSIFTQFEEAISKNAKYSCYYARDILEKPFLLGEDVISKDAYYSYLYARYVLTAPFKLGEEAISKNACYSHWYALNILKGPFPLGEEAISKNSEYSYFYARKVLKSPFKLGEKTISKDTYYSYNYALHVLEAPFKLGENTISKNTCYSNLYAQYVLK